MQENSFDIQLHHVQILEGIPSASGIVKIKEDFHVIGDDAPYLFQIDKNFNLLGRRQIYSSEKLEGHTIPKPHKPDFEAMEMISETEILVFGSGSKSPERDVCIWVDLKDDDITYQQHDVSQFYDHLRNLDVMQGYELNIEAFAKKGDVCYLFNRGRNVIFEFSFGDFMDFLKTKTIIPIVTATLFNLPRIKGLYAGFSGATAFQDKPYLIFTATVEDTPNAYDDGDIVGSFIGIIEVKNKKLDSDILIRQIPNPGFPLKVESVIIDSILSETQTDLVLVTDNDGLDSQILRLRMTLERK